jgi:hypothetical protein
LTILRSDDEGAFFVTGDDYDAGCAGENALGDAFVRGGHDFVEHRLGAGEAFGYLFAAREC